MAPQEQQGTESLTFHEVKEQLDSIVEQVSREDIPLDEALNLYEEAVSLGLQASRLMEEDITRHDAKELANQPDNPKESA